MNANQIRTDGWSNPHTQATYETKWPDAPERAGAFKTCADLQPLKEQPVLSDVSRVIADNYAAYHECRLKLNIWLEWYEIQRTIFEKAQ